MKYFYLIILTLFTVTHIDASGADSPVDEGFAAAPAGTKRVVGAATNRGATPTHSDSGSCAGSYAGSHGGASTIIAQHTLYELEMTADMDVATEYGKLMKAYQDLLRLSSKTDTRLTQFVGVVEKILPNGIDRSSADEDSLVSLRTAFRQLMDMYKALGKSYNTSTGKTQILESTVSELQAGQAELQATMAKMVSRPTEFVETQMSPERVFAARTAELESSDVVKDLRAENARLAAEIAALKAAPKPAAKGGAASKGGVNQPLLVPSSSSGGYTQLNDGEPAPRGQRNGQRKDEQACPCVVM